MENLKLIDYKRAFPDLDQVCDSISDLIVFLKPDGKIIHFNNKFAEFVGLEENAIIGRSCFELVHKLENFIEGCPLVVSSHTGKRQTREFKRGERYFSVAVDPIKDNTGKIIAFIHIMRDMTELIKTKEALRESEEKYRTIVDNIADAIVIIQGEVIKYVNKSAIEMSGYSMKEFIGKPFLEFIHPDDRNRAFELYRSLLGGEIDISPKYHFRIFDRRGNIRWIDVRIVKINWDGETALLNLITDITELIRAEEEKREIFRQLLHLQKMEIISKLSSSLGHELNNIFTAIKGFAQLTFISLQDEDNKRAYIQNIIDASEKAEELIKRLLVFSNNQDFEKKTLNINDFIKDMIDVIQRVKGENVALILNLSPEIGVINADPVQLENIIISIIANAREAMPQGGSIIVETSNFEVSNEFIKIHPGAKLGNYIRLSIKDSGFGISEDIKHRIFEPFFTTKTESSVGLGLSSVYAIVKQHGGYIWFESDTEQGTTFNILLPRIIEERESEEKYEILFSKGEETILVMDDNELVRSSTIEMLKKLGYRVLEAQNHDIAIFFAQFYPKSINLVLCDVVMPGISGVKIYSKIKQNRPDIKVLYMSGYNKEVISKYGINEEMDLIQKPFTIETLSKKIREVLDRMS